MLFSITFLFYGSAGYMEDRLTDWFFILWMCRLHGGPTSRLGGHCGGSEAGPRLSQGHHFRQTQVPIKTKYHNFTVNEGDCIAR